MVGIELVESKETRKSLDMKKVNDILEDCKENGVIFGKGGLRNNVNKNYNSFCLLIRNDHFLEYSYQTAFNTFQTRRRHGN